MTSTKYFSVKAFTFLKLLIIISLPLFQPLAAFPAPDWKLSWESGLFAETDSPGRALSRAEAQMGLRGIYRNNRWQFRLRFRPEMMYLQQPDFLYKAAAAALFTRKVRKGDLGLQFAAERHRYSYRDFTVQYRTLRLQGNWRIYLTNRTMLQLTGGGLYQHTSSDLKMNFDDLQLEALFHYRLANRIQSAAGIYLEKFKTAADITGGFSQTGASSNVNTGYRRGISLQLEIKKQYILNVKYRLLQHFSRLSHRTAENHLQLMTGRLFGRNWSAFLLARWTGRNFKWRQTDEEPPRSPLLYSPIDQENSFYLRVNRDFGKRLQLYFKSGFFHEEIIFRGLKVQSWQNVVGISFSS
ncbi:MAG: hypothetical protein WAN36_08075 [Calditrichia bacterium]